MFEHFTEQFQSAMKPASGLMAVNMQTLEKLTQHNSALLSSVVSDTMSYTKGLSTQKDLTSYMEAHKSYLEGLQDKFTTGAKAAYGILTEAQEQVSESWKDLFAQAGSAAKPAKPAPKAAS